MKAQINLTKHYRKSKYAKTRIEPDNLVSIFFIAAILGIAVFMILEAFYKVQGG
jgi:hypothetical protein